MKKKSIENITHEDNMKRIAIKVLTPSEKKVLSEARKLKGVDRPTFYHDAIVKYSNDTIKEMSNA